MRLYEIDDAIMDCVNEDGEVVDIDRLTQLEMERDKKISNIACWIKDLQAEAKAIKEEKYKLSARQKVAENKAENLKNYLQGYLNGAKFKDARTAISYRHSTETVYNGDVEKLQDKYCTIKRTPSLTAIKEALENGVVIEGAQLVEKESIQIK